MIAVVVVPVDIVFVNVVMVVGIHMQLEL